MSALKVVDAVTACVRVWIETEGGAKQRIVSDEMPLDDAIRLAAQYRATGHDVSVRLLGSDADVRAVLAGEDVATMQRLGIGVYIRGAM